MSNIGNLSFSVHLQDMTDADIAKIKQKLQNLSLSLNIDGNNIKVSNADVIKKQIENAVKSVVLPSVKIDTSAVKQQIESSTQGVIPQIRVSLLKDNLASDIQAYLNTKSFDVKISVLKTGIAGALKNIGTVTVPVSLKVDKKIALDGLKKSLLNMSVPIGVRMKSSKDLVKDIQERMKNTSVKVGIDVNKNVLRSNVTQALKGQTFKANLDLVVQKASVQQAIRSAFAQAGLKYNTTASDARQNLIDTRTMKASAYADAQKALADLRRAQLASSQAANQQGNSMQRVTEVAERQKGVFATLREQVANAYAVYRVGRFLNTAMRIGGEFQQQHIALQTIIGDADKANALFERIKNLAVESPFKMLDLSKYTKQLAAFSIPYEELYDTLKRFGDLSAGLGVDMGRIILAYGQVRSAEFLKGTELRQFTEAGIPLVTELAKKYTELRGTLVSVGDVYDMISKKQVPFSDVKDVLWNLTSEGGKFFNMQAALTDTLKGKLDKLADSYEIFLSEIANSNNNVLGGTLDLLADTLKHWELIQDVVMTAVSAYGTYKATLLAVAAVQKTVMMVEGLQKMIVSYQFLHNATKAAAVSQLAFNAAANANPYIMLAVGLATIAASMGLLFKNTNETAEATAKLNARIQEEGESSKSAKKNADKLASTMANEKASIDKRAEAYNKLRNIYPTMFENMTQEQAMLLKEAELRDMVAEAAKKETKEKLEASLVEAKTNVEKAQKNLSYWDKFRTFKDIDGVRTETTNKAIKEDYDKALADLVSAQNLVTTIQESIETLDKKAAEQAKRVASRWFKEAQDYVNSLPAEYKGLMPEENEERESYFERIGKTVSDLNSKIKELDENSSAAQEVLGGYTTERDYANNIYTKILGGIDEAQQKAIEDARKNREEQAQKDEKEREEAAKRLVQAYTDALKAEIAKVGSQWNLFKDLLEATGNEGVSMNLAFGGHISFKSQLEQLEKMIDDEIKKNNLGISVSELLNMSEGDIAAKINSGSWGEDMVKNLTSLTDAYKSENEKVKEESIRNFIEIVKNSNDFAQQIENIERKLQKDLNDLRNNAANGGLSKADLERREAELTAHAEEEKSKVRFEEFKKSSDWVNVFANLEDIPLEVIDDMIDKIEDLKAETTGMKFNELKELADTLKKLRAEMLDRNPFKLIGESITDLKKNPDNKEAWKDLGKGLEGAIKQVKELASAFADAFDAMGITVTEQGKKVLNGLEGLGIGLAEAFEGYGKEDYLQLSGGLVKAASGMANIMSGLFKDNAEKEEYRKYLLDIIRLRTDYNSKLIETKLLNEDVWGNTKIEDSIKAVEALTQAVGYYNELMDKEVEAHVDPSGGFWNKFGKANIWNPLGAWILGADSLDSSNKELVKMKDNLRYITQTPNMFRHTKTTDLVGWLKEEGWGDLFDKDGRLNLDLATSIKDWDRLTGETKEYLNNLIEAEEAIRKSEEALDDYLSDTFGDLGNQLSDAIVDAFRNGTDAAEGFKDSVVAVLEDVGAQIMRNVFLTEVFSEYEKDLKKIYGDYANHQDEKKFTEDLSSATKDFVDDTKDSIEAGTSWLEQYKKLMKEQGFDVFAPEKSEDNLSKGIQSITEDTGGLLASYVNAMRADVSVNRTLFEQLVNDSVPRMSVLAEAQLMQLQMIVSNTSKNVVLVGEIRDLVNRVIDRGSGKLKVG